MADVIALSAPDTAKDGSASPIGPLFFLQWHVTDRCNLDCTHCYREGARADLSAGERLAVLDSFSQLLAKLGRPGLVQFTGGEPLLSPDLPDLVARATDRGLRTRVLCNGTLATPESSRQLVDAGARWVQVSLEGLRDTHDAIRGAGTFDRALAGIRALREAGAEVTVSMTVSAKNVAEVEDVARLAGEEARRFHVGRLVPTGRGEQLADQMLTAEQTRDLIALLDRLARKRVVEIPSRDPLWIALRDPHTPPSCAFAGCAVGRNGITVDADGTVYPCRRLPIPLGNVRDSSLSDVCFSAEMQALADRDALHGRCGTCRLREACGGCRGVAWAVSGDAMAEDPQCFLADPSARNGRGNGLRARLDRVFGRT